MSGLPTLLVQLEDASGAFTHDVTAYVNLAAGWDMRRGRNDEDDDVEVGTVNLRLDNTDGRFTLGAANYDGITVDKRIRLTETVGATVSKRFTGYVQDWPTEWDSPVGNVAVCRVKAVDRQARLNRRKLRNQLQSAILASGPEAYYPLNDPAGSTTAKDLSGNTQPDLAQIGTGTAVVFGTEVGPGLDETTAAQFAGGQSLAVDLPNVTEMTIEAFFKRTGAPSADSDFIWHTPPDFGASIGAMVEQTTGRLRFNRGGSTIYSAASVADGQWHHAALTLSTTTGVLEGFLDGVSLGSLTPGGAGTGVMRVGVGGVYHGGFIGTGRHPITGALAHFALFSKVLTADEIAAHADGGLTGFTDDRSDERIARLAYQASIATAEQDLEAGVLSDVPAQSTSGESVYSAMKEVVDAEGGVLFFAGDGKLTFHNRQHRVVTAVQTAALALTSADLDHDDLTFGGAKDYLVNSATGSRTGGIEQRVTDAASLELYDEYPATLTNLLVATDQQVFDALKWLIHAYSEPRPRLSSFSVDLLTTEDQAIVEAVLAIELGDRLTVSGFPAQSPVATADLIVEGIKEEQSVTKWRVTFNTAPAALFHAWVVEDTTWGVLESTTKLHW